MKQSTSKIGLIAILAMFLVSLFIQPSQNSFTIISYGLEEVKSDSFDHSYSTYNSLLNRYVKDARVNYEGFINSRAEFETFLRALGFSSERQERWLRLTRLSIRY